MYNLLESSSSLYFMVTPLKKDPYSTKTNSNKAGLPQNMYFENGYEIIGTNKHVDLIFKVESGLVW